MREDLTSPARECTRCGEIRPLADFRPRSAKPGLVTWCRPCERERGRERYAKQRADPAMRRRWAEQAKRYQEAHPETRLAWRARNRERIAADFLRWRQENRDRWNEIVRRRELRLRGVVSDLTCDEWDAILAAYGHGCAYCGIVGVELTRDHVIPIMLGGPHSAHNLVPACRSCNSRKGAKMPETLAVLDRNPFAETA